VSLGLLDRSVLAGWALAVLGACASAPRAGGAARFSADQALPITGPEPLSLVRGAPPSYPADSRARGEEAALVVAFVLDTIGRVDPRTVSFLSPAPPRFRAAACDHLRRVQYQPMGAPRPQRVVVVSEFVFAVEGGSLWNERGHHRSYLAELAAQPWPQVAARLESAPHCA
jgi:Gram-negative bacterial TonB protein C-terminal